MRKQHAARRGPLTDNFLDTGPTIAALAIDTYSTADFGHLDRRQMGCNQGLAASPAGFYQQYARPPYYYC